jgi:hypothetical protein
VDVEVGGDLESVKKSDIEELSWDGLLIEEDYDNEETLYWSE